MRLSPPELGSLRIDLRLSSGTVNATFEASSPGVASLLHNQMHVLRGALESQGLNVEQLNVQTSSTPAGQQASSSGDGNAGAADDGRSRGRFDDSNAGQNPDQSRRDHEGDPADFRRELLDLVV